MKKLLLILALLIGTVYALDRGVLFREAMRNQSVPDKLASNSRTVVECRYLTITGKKKMRHVYQTANRDNLRCRLFMD